MYCPECQVEYYGESAECHDCHVPLVPGNSPRRTAIPFDPALNLVVILETNDVFALALSKGVLEEAGIPYFVLNEIAMLVTDVDPMLRKWVKVQVARDREREARELLTSLLHPEILNSEPGLAP